ncbi:MAG: FtsB family cell division protein [Bryobacteraceae bacterium]
MLRPIGYTLAFALVGGYAAVALRGPQGVSALLEKRHEIRQLQEQNADLSRENQLKRERIRKLQGSSNEQELEIRKHLKMLRPGETEFIMPDQAKTPAAPPQQ